MLRECEEMARYALASGLNVPRRVWETLDTFSGKEVGEGSGRGDGDPSP